MRGGKLVGALGPGGGWRSQSQDCGEWSGIQSGTEQRTQSDHPVRGAEVISLTENESAAALMINYVVF